MLFISQTVFATLAGLLAVGNAAVLEARATNTNLQTVFPASTGTSALAAAMTIATGATFDGAMKKVSSANPISQSHQLTYASSLIVPV